jgi:hypothetical protein
LEQPLRPTRSFSLILLSVVVLAACVLLMSAAIAMFTVTWDPCSLIGGVILLPLPAALAIQQYRGTFRYNAKAALISSVLLFIVSGFAFFSFAVTLGELVVEDVRIPWTSLILPMLAVGVVGGASALMNLSWSRRLSRSATEDVNTADRVWLSRRELLVAVTVIACVTALVTYFVRSTPPRYAENVPRNKAPFGLPAEATEISFCQGVRGTIAYEFTIDEKGFVEWVDSGIGSLESDAANVSIQPITAPYSIRRYNSLAENLTGADSITITNGLYYDWSIEDRGVYAAFDRTTNRAYYYAHFH